MLAPALAEARAGATARPGGSMGFSSQGSRGSRTFESDGGQSIQRSTTPQSNPSLAPNAARPGFGFGQNHPFLTGLAGAFFGSWLGSLLFPHWGMGMGYGFGGMLGSIFMWLAIIWGISLLFRMFRGRSGPMTSPSYGGMGYQAAPDAGYRAGGYGGGSAAPRDSTLAVNETDYAAFEAILKTVQGAWSKGDLATLRHYVTPEMLSYFAEELAEQHQPRRREPRRQCRADQRRRARGLGRGQSAICDRPDAVARQRLHDARRPQARRARLSRRGRSAAAERRAGIVDLRPQPGRPLAALGDPAGLAPHRLHKRGLPVMDHAMTGKP